MPRLNTAIDPASDAFRSNLATNQALNETLRARVGRGGAGRAGGVAPAPHRARQAAAAAAGRAPARHRLAVPGDRPAGRVRPLRRRGAGRRPDHRRWPRRGPRDPDHRQRRHREGRGLLPDHGEEAPARPGDRAAEPPAVRLSGRLRRREPAAPGRGVPRSRPFWPHLLQPGANERRGHRAGGLRDGLVHGGRRLRAGDERRDHHRPWPGHDLPWRPAAGEGGHRRGDQRRGARRRRHPWAQERRRRPRGVRRHPRAGDRPLDHRPSRRARRAAAAARSRPSRRPTIRPSSTGSSRRTSAPRTRCAR